MPRYPIFKTATTVSLKRSNVNKIPETNLTISSSRRIERRS